MIISPENKKVYLDEIIRSKELRNEIELKILSLKDELLIELMYNKYILGKTIEEICFILNYSQRQIERLHAKALDKIEI